jgi:TusA-related sulfurtransferase
MKKRIGREKYIDNIYVINIEMQHVFVKTTSGGSFMQVIDLRGVSCPTNFVKIKLALEDVKAGERLQILLDDGESVKNVPRSLKAEGHKLLALQQTDEGHYILELETAAE